MPPSSVNPGPDTWQASLPGMAGVEEIDGTAWLPLAVSSAMAGSPGSPSPERLLGHHQVLRYQHDGAVPP